MPESFLCADPIERYLGKAVEEMTDWDLISYLKHAMMALYGIDLAVEGHRERNVMDWLARTYTPLNRGRIIKWVVYHHFCRDSANPGQYIKVTSFAKGRKWWVDTIHAEMQQHVANEGRPAPPPVAATMISSAKFV